MKAKIILLLLWISLALPLTQQSAYLAYADNQAQQETRYVLLIVPNGSSEKVAPRKSPAIVLDTYQGIVWKCPDMQEDKPRWIKTDLGKNSTPGLRTKYVGVISGLIGTELKIAAAVLDTEEGKTWVCPNISSEDSKWELTVLVEKTKPAPEKTGIWGNASVNGGGREL